MMIENNMDVKEVNNVVDLKISKTQLINIAGMEDFLKYNGHGPSEGDHHTWKFETQIYNKDLGRIAHGYRTEMVKGSLSAGVMKRLNDLRTVGWEYNGAIDAARKKMLQARTKVENLEIQETEFLKQNAGQILNTKPAASKVFQKVGG